MQFAKIFKETVYSFIFIQSAHHPWHYVDKEKSVFTLNFWHFFHLLYFEKPKH